MAPLEPWEKVLVKEVFFTDDPHGGVKCTKCHNGNSNTSDKNAAHATVVAHPSEQPENFCYSCHPEGDALHTVLANFQTSIHKTQEGYFERFTLRAGYDLRDDDHLLTEFNAECGKCHASCGQCHISRPISVGSGFIDGHMFKPTPNMQNNCTACHGSRVGAEYFGENTSYTDMDGAAIRGDVHRFSYLKRCEFCHDGHEMHGDGTELTYRYDDANQLMPKCEDCHNDVAAGNDYHNYHWSGSGSKLACQVCHAQPYKSCNSCHVGGDGITGSSYQTLKIAKNYLKSANRDYDFITVRHIPIAPDTYAGWGVTDLPHFETSEPTWKLATPHNIQRWTAQTEVESGGCYSKCHDSDLYLVEADIQHYNDSNYVTREIQANSALFMDDLK